MTPEKFNGTQVYLSPKDKETLFHLVDESSLPDDQKERLMCKLGGYYLTDKSMEIGLRTQKRNAERIKAKFSRIQARF